jgi:hypothetical protein
MPSVAVAERRPGYPANEQDVLRVLGGLAAASRAYRLQVEEARLVIEVLAEDYGPAAVLLNSVVVASAMPARLGTPRHIELSTVEALKGLPQ